MLTPTRTAALLMALSLWGCGGGGSPAGVPDPVDDPPPGETVGLDTRPANSACVASEFAPSGSAAFELEAAFPELPALSQLVTLHQAPHDNSQWYSAQQNGLIRRFANRSDADSLQTVLDLSDVVVNSGEQGLLGMDFHPEFPADSRLFVYYSLEGPRRSRVSSVAIDGAGVALPGSETVILEISQPFANHNGGTLLFGPDGLLYLGLGDGGSGGDPQGHGQNTQTLLGSMLRIDVDGAPPYEIPADNPFASGGGAPEIFAWGLRNPFRWSFDRLTGELWAGDVGQNAYEEISIIRRGENYGWNTLEGFHCYNASSCDQAGLTPPVAEYPHEAGRSVTGGFVYRGQAIAGLRGRYVFGDFTNGRIWAIDRDAGAIDANGAALESGLSIAGFAEDNDGELYVLNYSGNDGRGVFRLVSSANSEPATDTVPDRLSQTGCVDMDDPTAPAEGTVSYAPAAAFWSDGASKARAAAIPNGTTLGRTGSGDFLFPVGSVLIKHFLRNDKPFETRLLMRHGDRWGGYSYRWNDAGDEALLLPDALDESVEGEPWHYPSRTECFECHTDVANTTLGLSTSQLNRTWRYPETGRIGQQLDTLAFINWFATPINDAEQATTLVDPADPAQALDARARAYLETNCAMCHQPGGSSGAGIDLRALVSLADMAICDVSPQSETLGIDDARLLAPGEPERSIIRERMNRRDEHAMPPLASRLVDADGVALIGQWIASVVTCP